MRSIAILVLCLVIKGLIFAQVSINADSSAPEPSAGLDVKFTNKGVLLPRLTQAQISVIANPANGLQVFCTTDSKMYVYVAPAGLWKEVAYGTGTINASCSSITIYHTADTVAPVTKTVTYSTVSGIPGEPLKCWITSNLGADHQADSVNDPTEASSGWYWQFNRKQGYMHDGTTLTPSWTITNIDENAFWIAANDPCTIEMGSPWRVPFYSEWSNIDNAGGWTNWNGPWESGLRLHAAGVIRNSDGVLLSRGVGGYYWSNMQYTSTNSFYFYSRSDFSGMINSSKARGHSLRCIRE